jgi:hypothetical protein
MELTDQEKEDQAEIVKLASGRAKDRAQKKWEHDYYWRRLINADYFKYIKRILTEDV